MNQVEFFQYLHLLIGDARISFISTQLASEENKLIHYTMNFNQSLVKKLFVLNSPVGVIQGVYLAIQNHPMLGFVSYPEYELDINEHTQEASISAVLSDKRYMPKVRIPYDLGKAFLTSTLINKVLLEKAEWFESYSLKFKSEEEIIDQV